MTSRSAAPDQAHAAAAPDDLSSRSDIDRLLVAFYSAALHDSLLGPVFAAAGLDLVTHLPVIGDFWQRSLLGSGSYGGRPMAVHRHLNRLVPLTPAMFDRWLALWAHAVDASFQGPVATRAKELATNVAATMQTQLGGQVGLPMVGLSRPQQKPTEDPR
jgi:hemoglobin